MSGSPGRSIVLVVCEESTRRSTLQTTLAAAFDVRTAPDIDSALDRLDAGLDPDCVVTVEALPDGAGLELAEAVGGVDPDLPVVLRPETADASVASAATGAGVTDYLPAAFDADGSELRSRVADAVATYQRRREQARDSDMFSSILDSLGIPIYVKDEQARHLRLSDVPGGPDPDHARGKTDPEIHDHEISRQSYEDDRSVIETGERIERKPEMHATGGIPVWFETTKVPWRDDDGSVKGLLGITYEITHLKETERKLQRRIHWLERFTDYVTHDLRNPIHVAQGNLELARLHVEDDPAEAIEAIEKSQAAIERMDDIVDDLSEMTEETDPQADPDARGVPIDLLAIVESVWDRLETGDSTLENEIPSGATIYGVESYLHPLFENLFKNAVEHGGEGTTVTVGPTNDGFFVADDGPGIPESQRERLDRPGYSDDTEESGTGLNIVADIAVVHNWLTEVGESESGGARFAFGNCLLVADPSPALEPTERLDLDAEADVGDVAVPGTATHDPETNRWTVSGAGTDLWRDTNEFFYVYRRVDHPVRITATVDSVEHVDDFSKAGLMVRDGLDESDTFSYIGQTPVEGSEVLWRHTAGDPSVSQQFDREGSDDRFRLTVDGDRLTASLRVDGEWEPVDQRRIDIDGTVTVGLAVCSVTPRYRCEAVFEGVTVERLDSV